MRSKWKRIGAALMALAMVVTLIQPKASTVTAVDAAAEEYEIYPLPQQMDYKAGSWTLAAAANVVVEEDIDEATVDRLNETLKLKNITAQTGTAVQDGKLNVLVGIHGSNGAADAYVKSKYQVPDSLFQKTDAYFLASSENTLVVVGAHTDAAFYGLTSLYHILKQMDGMEIRNFEMQDWADVVSRGFIEGYYGNPWSTENRADLMTWGGYYKLNSYFYAPKDDPKHNANWKELYTEDEVEAKIKPLAEAGNKSKCRFVYALHPYMSNPIRYTNDTVYKEDMDALKEKFSQVIEAGVRQIAILADDADNVGSANYKRTLEDMTAWIREKQQTYPDLKLTLPFCPPEYGGNGEAYMGTLPENVQVVMTGGKVWGEVSDSFTSAFMENTGIGPYMWINWPCTDNSKKHLIMGGYTTFLHAGADPTKIQGIVLNPMQQSEPSKVAIFGNACYSWNIWDSDEEAEQAWYDSFKYVDHNSALETEASEALRDISRHMINQAMDSRVTALEESQNISGQLTAFGNALAAGTVTEAQIDSLIEIFEGLKTSAATFKEKAGDPKLRDQMIYWLDCWDDTTTAALAYLRAVKATRNGTDANTLLAGYSEGHAAFSRSKGHGFDYVGETQYAEVGVQYIVPLLEQLEAYVSLAVQEKIGIEVPPVYKVICTPSWTVYQGDERKLYDGNDDSFIWYSTQANGAVCKAGDFIGYDLGRNVKIGSIHIVMGNGNQKSDKMLRYTVEISSDNSTWKAVPGYEDHTGNENTADKLDISAEGLEARYIRIRNLEDRNKWIMVSEFTIKEGANIVPEEIYTNIETDLTLQKGSGEVALTQGSVTLKTGEYVGIRLSNIRQILSVAADVPDTLKLEISKNGVDWEEARTGDARYVRAVNKGTSPVTWNITSFKVAYYTVSDPAVESNFGKESTADDMRDLGTVGNVFDGNLGTYAVITGKQQQGNYVVFDLGKERSFRSLRYYITENQKDYPRDVIFETAGSREASEWKELLHIQIDGFKNELDNTTAKDAEGKGLTHDSKNPGYMYAEATGLNTSGRYLRVRVASTYGYRWLGFSEILINNGEYDSKEQNRDVVSEAVEQPEMVPSNMIDGDISTSYKSSAQNSSATYYISEPKEVKVIRLFQVGDISRAKVTGELYDETSKEKKTLTLGVLGRNLNEFYIPAGKQLLSVKIEWKDVIPEIAEVMFTDTVDMKTVVQQMLEDVKDLRKVDYKGDSRKTYQEAREKLEAALADKTISEEQMAEQIQLFGDAVYGLEKVEMLELPFGDLNVVAQWTPSPIPDIQNVYSRELITGYGSEPEKLVNGKQVFGSLDNVTRGQFVTILYRMEGEPSIPQETLDKYKGNDRVFKDITAGDGWYYTDAVIWAAENKIVNGYTDDKTFRPNNKVSRQEMAAFLYRYAGDYLGIDTNADDYDLAGQGFKDATAPWESLLPAMKWTSKTGIITGKDVGKENGPRLAPFESATRTECAIILTRFLDKDAAGELPRK